MMTMAYFLAYSIIIVMVGPGMVSADAYHALFCPGQKCGVLKSSCRQSIFPPFFPASSMSGRCFWIMASLISSMVPSPSVFGRLIWIRPDLMILDIVLDFSRDFISFDELT